MGGVRSATRNFWVPVNMDLTPPTTPWGSCPQAISPISLINQLGFALAPWEDRQKYLDTGPETP